MSLKTRMGWLLAILFVTCTAQGASCVWKVTAPSGGQLYLAGSWHALRRSDYPLPSSFQRAFDASRRLALEVAPGDLAKSGSAIGAAGVYPKSDSLKNHVDPRTYTYLKRFFALQNVSEAKFARYRPWFIALLLQSPSLHGLSSSLGVEAYFIDKARGGGKPVEGLESLREHMQVFSGMNDRASEVMLLLTFIPAQSGNFAVAMSAWKHGDADYLASMTHDGFRDFPSIGDRLLDDRNRKWIPKLEKFLASGQTYFVIVGAGHLGGNNGVVSLLKARGYQLEQL